MDRDERTKDVIYGRCQICSMRATVKTEVASWCSTCWKEAFQARWLEQSMRREGELAYGFDELMTEWVKCRRALREYRTVD